LKDSFTKNKFMKQAILQFLTGTVISVLFISCGTISGKMSKVALVDAPRNIQAKANGERVDVEQAQTVSTLKVGSSGDTYTNYYSPVVKLSKKEKVTLELSSGSNNGSVDLTPKFSGSYLVGNMFVTGLVLGTAIDVATGNHKKHIRFVDVPAVLAGKPQSEWRSKGKLKKAIKKSAKYNK
jgi:hypothetical protein